jgi:hypothetical protein
VLALLIEGRYIGEYVADTFSNFFRNKSGDFSLTKVGILTIVVIALVALVSWLLRRFAHINAVGKIRAVFTGIGQGLGSIRFIKNRGWFLFHTVFIWLMYLLSTTAGIYALRETAHLGLGGGLTTLGVGSIGMIMTPGGIGAYPFLVEKLMMLYAISVETGKALGWLLWTAQTMIIVFGGLVFFALFSYINRKKSNPAGAVA